MKEKVLHHWNRESRGGGSGEWACLNNSNEKKRNCVKTLRAYLLESLSLVVKYLLKAVFFFVLLIQPRPIHMV